MSAAPERRAMFEVFRDIEDRLRAAKINFHTTSYRRDAFSFLVFVPGEYWEIDVLDDASVNVQIYRADDLEDDPWASIDRLVKRETED